MNNIIDYVYRNVNISFTKNMQHDIKNERELLKEIIATLDKHPLLMFSLYEHITEFNRFMKDCDDCVTGMYCEYLLILLNKYVDVYKLITKFDTIDHIEILGYVKRYPYSDPEDIVMKYIVRRIYTNNQYSMYALRCVESNVVSKLLTQYLQKESCEKIVDATVKRIRSITKSFGNNEYINSMIEYILDNYKQHSLKSMAQFMKVYMEDTLHENNINIVRLLVNYYTNMPKNIYYIEYIDELQWVKENI